MKLYYFRIARLETYERGCVLANDASDAADRVVKIMLEHEHLRGLVGKAHINVCECEKGYIFI